MIFGYSMAILVLHVSDPPVKRCLSRAPICSALACSEGVDGTLPHGPWAKEEKRASAQKVAQRLQSYTCDVRAEGPWHRGPNLQEALIQQHPNKDHAAAPGANFAPDMCM